MNSTEQQNALRIKVAELCGYKWFPIPRFNTDQKVLALDETNADAIRLGDWVWSLTPDYISDLDACHECEKTLTPEQRYNYIALVLGKSWGEVWTSEDAFNLCHATAEQRCHAFVATMEGNSIPHSPDNAVNDSE